MSDEEFVRANWEECEHRDTALGVLAGPHYIIIGNPHRKGWRTFYEKSKVDAWAVAAEFTRERLEQIRLIQEERVMLCGKLLLEDRDIAIMKRILVRLDAAQTDLKRGMTPTP